jgi:pectin methylesterase-like acyl-CoA thioesterase
LANTTVKAVYNTLTTYNYTVTKTGSQWGNVILNPAPTNGKYEAGTTVNMSIVPNAVTNFNYWEDNSTTTSRVIVVDADKSFTATFDEIPFIVGWNFLEQSVRTGRQGDFYSELSNTGVISLYEPAGTPVNWLASLASFSPSYPCARIWTAGASFASTRRYFEASFATTGYSNIQVKSLVGGNYQCYSIQKMQYSLDGINFTDLNSADITTVYNAGWTNLNATLPLAAEGQIKVYIRWVADTTSPILGLATDNDGMALTNIYVFADKVVVNDVTAPTLISSVPVEGSTNASANGSIVLTFDEKMIAGTGNCNLGATTLTPSFGSKTVTFPYTKLTYDTNYSFTVPAGALTDMSGNPYAGITVNFKTMIRPQPLAKVFDFVVAQDGSGNGTTIQSAFDAAPLNGANTYLIFVKNGTYNEYPSLAVNKNKVHLIGQSQDGVVITGSHYSGLVVNGVTFGTSTSQTVEILANDFYAENITIANTAGAVGQAVALKQYGDRGAMKNVKLSGFQDTHLTGTGSNVRQLYQNCRIEGAVDYIFGGGDIFFDQCLLYCVGRVGGDVCTAPSTLVTQLFGYVFNSCTIDGDATTQNNQFLLGRPWQNAPRSIYLNTKMNIVPASLGWTDMAVVPALFAEYNSTTATNSVIDLSNRKSSFTTDASHGSVTTSGLQTVLTDNQAAQYTLDNVLKGADSWQPLSLTETTEAPVNLTIGTGTLNWDATNYAICYVISRNNVVVGITTATTYTDATYSKSVIYDVVAVSESGALSAKKSISGEVTGLTALRNKIISYATSNELVLSNLPAQAKVELYSFSGKLLLSQKAKSSTATLPMLENNAIVRVISDKETVVLKVTKK